MELTETQADILAQLMRHVGRPVGRGDLLHRANWGPNNRSADVHVGHIRRKLEEAGIDALVIAAARGRGVDENHQSSANRHRPSSPA